MNKANTLQILSLFVNGLATFFLMNLANAYLINVLGVSIFGDFSLTLMLVFSITPFFAVGLNSLLTKYLPPFIDNKDTNSLNVFIKWNLKVLAKSIALIVLILIIIFLARVTRLNTAPCLIFRNCEVYRQTLGDLKLITPIALLLIWNSSLLAATKHVLASRILGPASITYACALIVFIMSFFMSYTDSYNIIKAIFLGFILLCILQYLAIFFLILIPKTIDIAAILRQKVSKKISSTYFKDGISLSINSIIQVIQGLAPVIIIEKLCVDDTMLGDYFIVLLISSVSPVLVAAFSGIMEPCFADIKNPNRKAKLQSLINYQILFGGLWTAFVIFDFLLFNTKLLGYYGGGFIFSTFSVCFMMIFSFFSEIIFHTERLCVFNNLNQFLHPITIAQTVLLIVLCFVLIPYYQYLGALLAIAISRCLAAVACWVIIKINGIEIKVLGII